MGQTQIACDASAAALPFCRPRLTQATILHADAPRSSRLGPMMPINRTSFSLNTGERKIENMSHDEREALRRSQELSAEHDRDLGDRELDLASSKAIGPATPGHHGKENDALLAKNLAAQDLINKEEQEWARQIEIRRGKIQAEGPAERPPMVSLEEESPWTGWPEAAGASLRSKPQAMLQIIAHGGIVEQVQRGVRIQSCFVGMEKGKGPDPVQLENAANQVVGRHNIVNATEQDMAAQNKEAHLIAKNPSDSVKVDFHNEKAEVAMERAAQNFRGQQVELMNIEQAKDLKLAALVKMQSKMDDGLARDRPRMISIESPYYGDLRPEAPPPSTMFDDHKYLGPEIGIGLEKPLSMPGLPSIGEQPEDVPIAKFPGIQAEMVPDNAMAEASSPAHLSIPMLALYAAAFAPPHFPSSTKGVGAFPTCVAKETRLNCRQRMRCAATFL